VTASHDASLAPGTAGLPPDIAKPLRGYRVMATIVGVLLVVLCLVGVPLANFDGTPMWGVFDSTPAWITVGSAPHTLGELITEWLGVAHGWLYMIFLFMAFWLSRRAVWPIGFTLVTLVCGTVPLLSFWAERRATRRVLEEHGAR
jgi:integral membrane protein